MKYYVEVNGRERLVELSERLGKLTASVDGQVIDIAYESVDDLGQLLVLSNGKSYGVSIEGESTEIDITIAGHVYDVRVEDERERAAHAAERASNKAGGLVKSIMPGVVVELLVTEGQEVAAGQPLLILEAMKMQNEIEASHAGVIRTIHVKESEAVAAGAKLVHIEAPDEES